MHGPLFLTICLLPAALTLLFFMRRMKQLEMRRLTVVFFAFGAFLFLPVIYVDHLIYVTFGVPMNYWLFVAYEAFIIAALVEEGGKFLVFRLSPYQKSGSDRPSYGMLLGIVLAIGFGTVENLKYVMLNESADLELALLRALIVLPAHALDGALMGYFFARAKFDPRCPMLPTMLNGLLLTMAFHGLYDFFLLSQSSLAFVAFVVLGVQLLLVVGGYRRLRRLDEELRADLLRLEPDLPRPFERPLYQSRTALFPVVSPPGN